MVMPPASPSLIRAGRSSDRISLSLFSVTVISLIQYRQSFMAMVLRLG